MGHFRNLEIRDARLSDVMALTWIRHAAVVHEDRIRDAATEPIRYLLAVLDGVPIGWAVLVLAQPKGWPALSRSPQVLDVIVGVGYRGKGVGSRLLTQSERIAREAGCEELWFGVDPGENLRARALYQNLGYKHDGEPPVTERWSFEDSAGGIHRGEERLIYLRRQLSP